MSNRTRKNWNEYRAYTLRARQRDCDFCAFKSTDPQFVARTKYFWVVRNIFPFDIWDTSPVEDHLMLVPRRHVDSIGNFTVDEKKAFANLTGEYDLKGYAIYARPKGSHTKSVVHQHTHLIRLNSDPKTRRKLIIFLKKPWVLIHK